MHDGCSATCKGKTENLRVLGIGIKVMMSIKINIME